MKTKLLDCTLRDGGFINNWNFGQSTANYILQNLINANIDIIEIGFIDENVKYNNNKTIAPNTKSFDRIFKGIDKKSSKIFVMVDYGKCSIENFHNDENSLIDGVRIIFKKENIDNALDFAEKIRNKGFLISLQLVSTTSYNDDEIIDFCKKSNSLNPYSIAIVDTYGLMYKEALLHYFKLLQKNINEDIAIGYHSHNNFQLAYSNSIELIKFNQSRRLIIDGSLYGMGKNAGNTPTELLAMYLNDNYASKYKLEHILETIDSSILKLHKKLYWGYSFKHYLSALNECHPNYTEYLLNKKTLSIKSTNTILSKIKKENKLNFSETYIEGLYLSFQNNSIDDTTSRNNLKAALDDKKILLLAPGKTLSTHSAIISNFISTHKPIIFSINSIPDSFPLDYIFITNSKRYSSLYHDIKNYKNLIITSNINNTNLDCDFSHVLDYKKLIITNSKTSENSLLMLIKFLLDIEQKNITIAGFDGFAENRHSYYDEFLDNNTDSCSLNETNNTIKQFITEIKKHINLHFLTPSIYDI